MIFIAGAPIFSKDLFLKGFIKKRELASSLVICSLIVLAAALLLLVYAGRLSELSIVALFIFWVRLVAGYVEIYLNVSHEDIASLRWSFAVELLFLIYVGVICYYGFDFGELEYTPVFVVLALLCAIAGVAWLIILLKSKNVFKEKYRNLAKFSSIEMSSIIAFGLDVFWVSLFFNEVRFAIYVTIIRLFSPITQFQGVVTRYMWSAGYNSNVGYKKVDYLSRVSVVFSFLILLSMLFLSSLIFNIVGIELDIVKESLMMGIIVLTYASIILNRHFKNLANSMGVTSDIWRVYFLSALILLSVCAGLWLLDLDFDGEIYLFARLVFFFWVSYMVYGLIKANKIHEK